MIDQNDQARLNEALEAMYFGFRALIAKPDARLDELGLSRVHHRLLYFIARHPDCSIHELLTIMGVSKQYIHKPLKRLVEEEYVQMRTDGEDRRRKRLRLRDKGSRLESELSGMQRAIFQRIFLQVGPQSEAGWREVMRYLRQEGKTKR